MEINRSRTPVVLRAIYETHHHRCDQCHRTLRCFLRGNFDLPSSRPAYSCTFASTGTKVSDYPWNCDGITTARGPAPVEAQERVVATESVTYARVSVSKEMSVRRVTCGVPYWKSGTTCARLYNRTRPRVKDLFRKTTENCHWCVLREFVPRISLIPNDLLFEFKRLRFPLKQRHENREPQ